MGMSLEIANVVIPSLALIGVFVGAWIHFHVRIKSLEIQVAQLQKYEEKSGDKFAQIMEKLDEMKGNNRDSLEVLNDKINGLIVEITKIRKN
jgi:uncharacterized coiled-coil protein SlyX